MKFGFERGKTCIFSTKSALRLVDLRGRTMGVGAAVNLDRDGRILIHKYDYEYKSYLRFYDYEYEYRQSCKIMITLSKDYFSY